MGGNAQSVAVYLLSPPLAGCMNLAPAIMRLFGMRIMVLQKNSVRPRINELHCLQINKGEFNVAVVKCLGLIRQAVKCRQFERPAAAAVTDGIGGNKAAIAAIMKEFNDIVSSVKAP